MKSCQGLMAWCVWSVILTCSATLAATDEFSLARYNVALSSRVREEDRRATRRRMMDHPRRLRQITVRSLVDLKGGSSNGFGPSRAGYGAGAQENRAFKGQGFPSSKPQTKPSTLRIFEEVTEPEVDTSSERSASGTRTLSSLQQRDSRVGFVRKVYGLLSLQLIVTFGAVFWTSTHKQLVFNLLNGPQGQLVMALPFGVALVCPFLLTMRQSLQSSHMTNFLILALFTLAESVCVSIVSCMFTSRSVLLAVAQTAAATVGLTAFALQPNPKYDLSAFGSLLFSGLIAIMTTRLISWFLPMPPMELLMSCVTTLLFSGFIVYDTRRITEGNHPGHSLQPHQHVLGAMILYTDIIGLFLQLLRLFGETEN